MLPDLLKSGLRLIVCGTAAGKKSAELKQYYAGRGNKFWSTLYKVGLTPVRLYPNDYAQLLNYGIGLTDLVKNKAGMDFLLLKSDFGLFEFVKKIELYYPKILCFNGKKAAQEYFSRPVEYGLQKDSIGRTKIYIAPSTSSAAGGYWDISFWENLSELIK